MANERYINFYYDPAREGYDTTLWKTVSGTPTVASSKIRLNAAKIIGYADMFKADVTYKMVIPTVPMAFLTGGSSATTNLGTWQAVTGAAAGAFAMTVDGVAVEVTGLDFAAVASMDDVAEIIQAGIRTATGDSTTTCEWVVATTHFLITSVSAISVASTIGTPGTTTDISGAGGTPFMDAETGVGTVTDATAREFGLQQMGCTAGLTFKIASGLLTCEALYEGVSSSTTVPWESAWTNANTYFTIKWTGFSADFLINGIRRAFVNNLSVPKKALSMMFTNTSSDNMDIVCIDGNNIQGYI